MSKSTSRRAIAFFQKKVAMAEVRLKQVEGWLADKSKSIEDRERLRLQNERAALRAGLDMGISQREIGANGRSPGGPPDRYQVLLTGGLLYEGAMEPPAGLPEELSDLYCQTVGALLFARMYYDGMGISLDHSYPPALDCLTKALTFLKQAQTLHNRHEIALGLAGGGSPSAVAEALDWIAEFTLVALTATDRLWDVPHRDISRLIRRIREQFVATAAQASPVVESAHSEPHSPSAHEAASPAVHGKGLTFAPMTGGSDSGDPQLVLSQKPTVPLSEAPGLGNAQKKMQATDTIHNADFTMVRWFGIEYHFSLGVQSSAVKALWNEWQTSGLGLHQATIRDAVDAERDNFRMDTAFRNHPALGTMIQSCGDGRYKLAAPDTRPESSAPKAGRSAKIASKSRQKRG
jgi:hypothetical protein